MEKYDLALAGQRAYDLIWNEFCDWYLELIKPDMKEEGPRKTEAQYVLWTALREFLILMHPIMPFVTAEIWQALPGGAGSDAAVQLLPDAGSAAAHGAVVPDDDPCVGGVIHRPQILQPVRRLGGVLR